MKSIKASKVQLAGAALALLMLLGIGRACGQDIPLEVLGGDVKKVKVDKVVVIKEDRTVVSSFPFTIAAPPGAGLYFWTTPAGVNAADRGDKLLVEAAPKGSLTISVKSINANLDKDGKFLGFLTKFGAVTFDVGGVVPPVPPTPPPDPTPIPTPDIAPYPSTGLTALIIYESSEETPSLSNLMSGDLLNSYILTKGVKNGFMKFDKDLSDFSKLDPWVAAAWKVERKSLPWLLVSNGKTGFSGPLPMDAKGYSAEKTLEIFKKHGDSVPRIINGK